MPEQARNILLNSSSDDVSQQHPKEVAVIDGVIRKLMTGRQPVTNKNVIKGILNALEQSRDNAQSDMCRGALELLMGSTQDDI